MTNESLTSPRRVYSPVVTPFKEDLSPDGARLVRHCQWLLKAGVGLAVFGTNSEGNSMSVAEKTALLDDLSAAGISADALMPGTGCCAIPDTVELTRHVLSLGIHKVLMLPPFYYKGVSDDGLFKAYSEVVQAVGDAALRIYLYHIPPVSNVPISLSLIERLLAAYSKTFAGIKDSSGDWDNTRALIKNFSAEGFEVYAGSEVFLLRTLKSGGVGCITATGNVNPGPIVQLANDWQGGDAEDQQAALTRLRKIFQTVPVIPALKAAIEHYGALPGWGRVRPPLVALDESQRAGLLQKLQQAGFSMPGLKQ